MVERKKTGLAKARKRVSLALTMYTIDVNISTIVVYLGQTVVNQPGSTFSRSKQFPYELVNTQNIDYLQKKVSIHKEIDNVTENLLQVRLLKEDCLNLGLGKP